MPLQQAVTTTSSSHNFAAEQRDVLYQTPPMKIKKMPSLSTTRSTTPPTAMPTATRTTMTISQDEVLDIGDDFRQASSHRTPKNHVILVGASDFSLVSSHSCSISSSSSDPPRKVSPFQSAPSRLPIGYPYTFDDASSLSKLSLSLSGSMDSSSCLYKSFKSSTCCRMEF